MFNRESRDLRRRCDCWLFVYFCLRIARSCLRLRIAFLLILTSGPCGAHTLVTRSDGSYFRLSLVNSAEPRRTAKRRSSPRLRPVTDGRVCVVQAYVINDDENGVLGSDDNSFQFIARELSSAVNSDESRSLNGYRTVEVTLAASLTTNTAAGAVLGRNIWGAGSSSFGRQQRLSEITIEPIASTSSRTTVSKNLGRLGKIWGPGPNIEPPLTPSVISSSQPANKETTEKERPN